jgi:hypothetical protein
MRLMLMKVWKVSEQTVETVTLTQASKDIISLGVPQHALATDFVLLLGECLQWKTL